MGVHYNVNLKIELESTYYTLIERGAYNEKYTH